MEASPRAARARTRLYTILRARGETGRARVLLVEGLRFEPQQRTWERALATLESREGMAADGRGSDPLGARR